MKFAYNNMEHILSFKGGYVNELVIENKKMFFEVTNSIIQQSEGLQGNCILSISDKPVEFSKYTDVTIQFTPLQVNRKSLLAKLYSSLERNSLTAENYTKTNEILFSIEQYIMHLSEDLPFEISCQKLSIGPIIRAISPVIDEYDKTPLEKMLSYMELVRELDRERLFIMINMRSYFLDEDMEKFIETLCFHDFKVLLLESTTQKKLKNTHRCTIDQDLCEF